MLVCNRCGDTIREDELGSHDSFLADLGDECVYETVSDTCSCGGDYVEGLQCNNCGCWFVEGDIVWGSSVRLCKGCLAEFKERYADWAESMEDDEFIDTVAYKEGL